MKITIGTAVACLLSTLVFFAPSAWCAQTSDTATLQRILFTRLMLDDDPAKSQLGVQHVERLPYGTDKDSLCDIIAERLLYLANPSPKLDAKMVGSISWHVRVLADANIGRYRGILLEARQRYGNLKVLARIDAALTQSDLPQVQPYEAHGLDFKSMRNELDATIVANRKQSRVQFGKLQPGSELDIALDQLGAPDAMSTTTVRVAHYGHSDLLTMHYLGAGIILYRHGGENSHQWVAAEFVDELFDVRTLYNGQYLGEAQSLASLRGLPFREYVGFKKNHISKEPGMQNVLEKRLLTVAQAADKQELKGMVAGVRVIARSGNRDALDSLRRISEGSTVRAVKVAAQKEMKDFGQKQASNDEGDDSTEDESSEAKESESER